jgi:hypothetical protein
MYELDRFTLHNQPATWIWIQACYEDVNNNYSIQTKTNAQHSWRSWGGLVF